MSSSTPRLFATPGRKGFVLALCLVGSVFGCFKDPHPDVTQPRKCETDKSCPEGFVCGSNKLCCASSDGKTCSNPVSTGGAGGRIDGSPDDAPIGRESGAGGGGMAGGAEVGAGGVGSGGVVGFGGMLDGGGAGGGVGTGGVVGGSGGNDGGPDAPLGGANGGAGAGGITALGGGPASGGIQGLGGTTGPGGTNGSGGVSPTGGTVTPSGGAIGTGGKPGTGGAGTGGTPGTGGAPACQGTATKCSDNGVQTCSNGQWGGAVACSGAHQTCTGPEGTAGCTCAIDSVCKAIGGTCASPSTLVTCLQDAQSCFYQSSAQTCTNGACTGAAGSASCCTNACTAGTTKCLSSTELQTCSTGSACTAYSTTNCTTPEICYRPGTAACADPTWAQWPMPNGQTDVTAGAPNLERYTDNGDDTVTDNVTGLIWQRTILETETYTWDNAMGHCKTGTFSGRSDWHLPSEIELLSIVDYSRKTPSINTTAFPGTPSTDFWSSSPLVGVPNYAWAVQFDTGGPGNYYPTSVPHNVRCVR
jgi:hypothetical protein